MLIAAAVCPHPPALVPAATGNEMPPGHELARVRDVCHVAVEALLSERPDLLAVVGGGPRTVEYPPAVAGGLHEYGVPFTIGEGTPVLPLSLTVGRWLLSCAAAQRADELSCADAKIGDTAAWHAIASDAAAEECLRLGAKIAERAPRVAMLVMGDGPGRRARQAPGAIDVEADRFDGQAGAALGAGDAKALAGIDEGEAAALFVAGRAAWQVLAGSAGVGTPLGSADAAGAGGIFGEFAGELLYAGAPLEVSYFVARWRRAVAG
jgi:hypothetical protein